MIVTAGKKTLQWCWMAFHHGNVRERVLNFSFHLNVFNDRLLLHIADSRLTKMLEL